jgi:hypothetical protein
MSAVAERAGIPRESLYPLRIRADQRQCQMAGGLMQRFPKACVPVPKMPTAPLPAAAAAGR